MLEEIVTGQARGAIATPAKKNNKAIVVVTGFLCSYEWYMDYLVLPLSRIWPVYVTEVYRKGIASGESLVKSLHEVDAAARNVFKSGKLVYLAHSMGMPVTLEATKNKHVLGYLGMATYPSFGDCYTMHQDSAKRSFVQHIVDCVSSAYGPLSYPLKHASVNVPINFVMGAQDEIVMTRFKCVQNRFKNYFRRFPKESHKVIPGNHWFNDGLLNFCPFNKSHPEYLINEVIGFMKRM